MHSVAPDGGAAARGGPVNGSGLGQVGWHSRRGSSCSPMVVLSPVAMPAEKVMKRVLIGRTLQPSTAGLLPGGGAAAGARDPGRRCQGPRPSVPTTQADKPHRQRQRLLAAVWPTSIDVWANARRHSQASQCLSIKRRLS